MNVLQARTAPKPKGGRLRLTAVGTIIATMALLLVSLVAAPANAVTDTGSITGTITLDGDAPIAYTFLKVYAYSSDAGHYGSGVITPGAGSTATYSIGGLGAGTYSLSFYDDNNIYSQANIGEVPVASGLETSGQNVTLNEIPKSITGTITLNGDTAFSGTYLQMYSESDEEGYRPGTVTQASDSTATYSIRGLANGTYTLHFYDNNGAYAEVFISGVVVSDAVITGQNVTLNEIPKSITGTISPVGGGTLNPSSEIYVDVYNSAGNYVADALVNVATGVYTVRGLETGSYRLQIRDYSGNPDAYASEYYNDKATLAEANTVSVTAGVVTSNIDAQLTAGGTITGTVSPVGGGALNSNSEIYATAYDSSGDEISYGSVNNTTGAYTVSGLGARFYRMQFRDYSNGYATEYYNDKATLAEANTVSVTAGVVTSNIDAHLAAGGSITGTVSPVGGGALNSNSEIYATVYDSAGERVTNGWVNSATGAYTIGGLGDGVYRLHFGDDFNVYASEYYNDKTTLASANTVQVTAGAVTSNIDAQLAAYVSPPLVSSLTPASGSAAGGTAITIRGTGFDSAATASFGGSACAVTGVTTATSLTCTTTSRAVGVVDVVVTNPDMLSGTKAGGFTFLLASPGIPGAPTVIAGDAIATVSVTAGTGGAPSSFTVTGNPGGAACTVTAPDTSCVVGGLTNGTAYTFTATATNATGASSASARSSAVTPTAPAPAPYVAPTPTPTPVPPAQVPQSAVGGVKKQVKAQKNKKYSLPTLTTAGVALKWKSASPKVCKIKGSKVALTGKRGMCKLVAVADANTRFLALTKQYAIKVK